MLGLLNPCHLRRIPKASASLRHVILHAKHGNKLGCSLAVLMCTRESLLHNFCHLPADRPYQSGIDKKHLRTISPAGLIFCSTQRHYVYFLRDMSSCGSRQTNGESVLMPEAATAMRSPGLKSLFLTMVSWTSLSNAP